MYERGGNMTSHETHACETTYGRSPMSPQGGGEGGETFKGSLGRNAPSSPSNQDRV